VRREDPVDQAVQRRSPGLGAGAALGGLVLLGVIGWVAWNQGALVGLRWVEFDSPLTLAAFGFVAGIGAFFAPCAFALFPGYISYYLTSVGTGRETAGRSVALGLTCAAGSAVFFALAGIVITLVGGAAFLVTWDIPAPVKKVERVLPDDRFPR